MAVDLRPDGGSRRPQRGIGPLQGIRVLDLADQLGAYAGRLMADLGADVIRVEPVERPGSLDRAPFWLDEGQPTASVFERFVNAGKRSVTLDIGAPEAAPVFEALLASADVLIESPVAVLVSAGWTAERVAAANGDLIRIQVSPYGADTSEIDSPTDDLVLLGAGGLLAMGGYPDVGPVAAYGQQTTYMASIFAAVAAIAGLIGRQRTGQVLTADVSAQECVAQALEESVVRYAMTGEVRSSQGDVAKEAGTGCYRCADGYVSMVAGRLGTATAWASLVDWIVDNDSSAVELTDERWSRFEVRQLPESIETFREIFERFASTRSAQELYRGAQERGIALSPVNDLSAVRRDAQLVSRDFFVELEDPELGATVTFPGLPYRMSGTPLRGPRTAPRRGADNVDVYVSDIGLARDEVESLTARGVL